MDQNFYFSKVEHLEKFTFDESLEKFRQQMIEDGLNAEGPIREIIQNSLDARNYELDESTPVKVELQIGEIHRNDIPGINGIFDHIDHLIPGSLYTKKTIEHMKKFKNKKKVRVLTASDSNTRGLSGADSPQKGTFHAYAYHKGVHGEADNEIDEKTRGGSHGVGKIANNAASDLHLMFFSNCDEFGNKHIGGSVQLFNHKIDNKNYAGTGFFTNKNNTGNFKPYKNNLSHEIFQKNDRGLKVIIPYLREELDNKEDIIKSVINNFFVSIIDKKLVVTVIENGKKTEINKESIAEIAKNIYPTDVSDMKKELAPLFIHTYLNTKPTKFEIVLPKKYDNQTFNFNLYFYDENENIPAGRTAIVRSMGMKIEEKKVTSHATTPYNAILIGGPNEDEFIKMLENESHTALSYEAIRDPSEKRKAKKFLSTLNNNLREKIEKSQSEKYTTEGEIDTSDLIYQMNWEFNGKVNKDSRKIELTDGTNIRISNEKERRNSINDKGKSISKKSTKNKRKPRRKRQLSADSQEVVNYIVPSSSVNRAIVDNHEIIKFNFNQIENSSLWKNFNLSLRLVDGQGMESRKMIDLTKNYEAIKIMNSNNESLSFDHEKIYNIPITRAESTLLLTTKLAFNPNLKYVYQVEVNQ